MFAARSILLALLCVSGAAGTSSTESVAFRTDMLGTVTFSAQGTSDIATAMLTETMGIVCYSDWKNPEDGQCNAVDMSNSAAPTSGAAVVLTEDRPSSERKAQRFTMSAFSSTMAVVCYTPFGDQTTFGRPVCRTLTVTSGTTLSAGDELEFAPNSTNVYTMSLASLTEQTGVLCFQDTSVVTAGNRRDVVCILLKVTGTTLSTPEKELNDWGLEKKTYANKVLLDNVQTIAMSRVSDSSAVVCYNDGTTNANQGRTPKSYCNKLTLSEDNITVGGEFVLGANRNWGHNAGSKALSVDALSESDGIACMCNDEDGPTCIPLDLSQSNIISTAGESFAVAEQACNEVSVVAMSDTAAVVCYLADTDGTTAGQRGRCNGLAYLQNTLITGDAVDFPDVDGAANSDFSPPIGANPNSPIWRDNDAESWFSVSKRDESNAMACYSAVGASEEGRCIAVNIPEPTTTATTETTTETSSTTEHTTTETSSTTATHTSVTDTATTETSSTTPHTTTESTVTTATETSVTALPDSSGAVATRAAGCFVGAFALWTIF